MPARCRKFRLAVSATALAALAGARPLAAAELIFPGIAPKLEAGAGQTTSRGASALFYNPANLIFSKFIEPYVDVSYAMVNYTYQHTDTAKWQPAVVKVNAPPVTAGFGLRPIPDLALGIAILPTGTGSEQAVLNVPLQVIGNVYQLCNISTKQSGYEIAGGAAYRVGLPLTIGLGAIYGSESTALIVTPVDSATGTPQDQSLVDAKYGGTWTQFLLGVRSELFDRSTALALSYKTAVVKVYKGDYLVNTGPQADYVVYEGKGYLPAVIGFGAEARFGAFGAFLDVTHEMWSAGRAVYKRGLGNDGDLIDYLDTNNLAAGVKFWVAPKHMLTVAAGSYGANIGDGTVQPVDTSASGLRTPRLDDAAAGTGDPVIKGVSFGDLNAIARLVVSGGYRAKLSGTGYLEAGGSYQTGSRVVPPGADGEGKYTLSVIMLSVGVAYGF